jgi:hypothetical protein
MAKKNREDQAPDPLLQQLIADYEMGVQQRLEAAKAKLRTEIIPRLKKWGVARLKAEYSGYGDSGAIDSIEYLDSHDQPVNMDMVRSVSDPAIENALYELLPSGFEINEGGQGDVTIDVATGIVTLDHQENYTETRDSSEQWEV